MEQRKDIEAGNSFRSILFAMGVLLKSSKKLICDGICWFPRLMSWKTSKGEVAPMFLDYWNEGYNYWLKAHINIITKEKYNIESIQAEIQDVNPVGTLKRLKYNSVVAE